MRSFQEQEFHLSREKATTKLLRSTPPLTLQRQEKIVDPFTSW